MRWIPQSLARQIVGGSAVSIGVRVAGVGLSYAANIMLSRLLGLSGYGQYAIALGWALILVLPARLGLDYSALRVATAYLEAGETASLRGFIRASIGLVVSLSLVIALAMVLVAAGTADEAGILTVAAAAALVAPVAVVGILSVMMRISGRHFASQFYDQVMRPAALIFLVGIVSTVHDDWGPPSAMLCTAMAAWLSLGVLSLHFRKAFHDVWSVAPKFKDMANWFKLSLPLLGVTVVQELLNQLEIILLGALADPQSAGLFAAASRLVSLMTFALAAFGIVSGPLVASAFNRNDLNQLRQLTCLTARLGLLFACGVALVLLIGGKLLLALFGPDFYAAYEPMLILVAGGLVNAFTGIVVYLTTLTGRERTALTIFLSALAVSLVLNLLLIPRLGIIGAAIASTSALSFWNIAMLVYVRRALGIDASAFGLKPRLAAA